MSRSRTFLAAVAVALVAATVTQAQISVWFVPTSSPKPTEQASDVPSFFPTTETAAPTPTRAPIPLPPDSKPVFGGTWTYMPTPPTSDMPSDTPSDAPSDAPSDVPSDIPTAAPSDIV